MFLALEVASDPIKLARKVLPMLLALEVASGRSRSMRNINVNAQCQRHAQCAINSQHTLLHQSLHSFFLHSCALESKRMPASIIRFLVT